MDNKKRAELILRYLPDIKNQKEQLVRRQSSHDIVRAMMETCLLFQKDYDRIPSDMFASLEDLWRFTKEVFTYKEDSSFAQDLKSPGVMLSDALHKTNTIDCKGYSNFIAGILQGWINDGEKIDWFYKFVSYTDSEPSHVYIVANGYILDCCEKKFDKESISYSYICANPFTKNSSMAINRISGKKNMINHNPTPFGRQGQIGEGNKGGGGKGGGGNDGGGKGGGDKGGDNKDKTDKGDKGNKGKKDKNVPLFAPKITISQPTANIKTGSLAILSDTQTKALFLAGVNIVIVKQNGEIYLTKTTTPTDAAMNQINIGNIPVGKYVVAFQKTVKGKKVIGKGTSFEIVGYGSIPSPVPGGNPNPSPVVLPKDNTQTSSLLSPTNLAIGAGVIIGGYLLLKKKN